MWNFAIVDESTAEGSKPEFGGTITVPEWKEGCEALTVYMNRDFAYHWGGLYQWRYAGVNRSDVKEGEVPVLIMDKLEVDGAVAFHDKDGNAIPYIELGREYCTSFAMGSSSVTGALGHEGVETGADAPANMWADAADVSWALETGDPVQEWGYNVNGIYVSDFVLPRFFGLGSKGPWNFGATHSGPSLRAPFTLAPGGYAIVRKIGTGEKQIYGSIGEHRAMKKLRPSSRTMKRLGVGQEHVVHAAISRS